MINSQFRQIYAVLLPNLSMSSEELKEQIKEMLVTNLMLRTPREEISNDLPLFSPDGLGLDSIDALQLVVSMEKTFGVGVPNLGGHPG